MSSDLAKCIVVIIVRRCIVRPFMLFIKKSLGSDILSGYGADLTNGVVMRIRHGCVLSLG